MSAAETASGSAGAGASSFRERGNEALRAGDFRAAVAAYSEGLAAAPTDHVLLSNRAIAHLRAHDADAALRDADECIRLQSGFAKAHATRGSALRALGRLDEALESYRQARELDPARPEYRQNVALVEAELAASAEAAMPPPVSAAPRPVQGTPASLMTLLGGDVLETTTQFLRTYAVVAYLLYIVGFQLLGLRIGWSSYYNLLLDAVVLNAIQVFRDVGRPRWSLDFAQQVLTNPAFHLIWIVVTFYFAHPNFLVPVPLFALEMVYFALFLHDLASFVAPPLAPTLDALGARLVAALAGTSPAVAAAQSRRDRVHAVFGPLRSLSAYVLLALGFVLILEAFTSNRNLIVLLLHWQFLRVSYVVNADIQRAFHELDQLITQLTLHDRCPALVRTGYEKLRGLIKSYGDLRESARASASGAAAGAGSACTIA